MEATLLRELHRIQRLSVSELRAEWARLYNGEVCRSRNKTYLAKRLCWRLQEMRLGGLSDRTKAKIDELVPDSLARARTPREALDAAVAANKATVDPVPGAKRDPRLPSTGAVISRVYRGRELQLLVLDDGFELDGQHYQSLSEAARAVTGSKWNGRLFWGLTERKRK